MQPTHGGPASAINRRRFLGTSAGALASLWFTACGGTSSHGVQSAGGEHTKQIALAIPDTSAANLPVIERGAKEVGKQRGFEILMSHANDKLDRQVSEINTWIAARVGGIIVLPLDNDAMIPLIKKAHGAGVKFLDYSDDALPGTDGWMIFDNLQGAHLVGDWAAKWAKRAVGDAPQVALLTHEVQKTGRDRINGAVKAFKKVLPNAKVVARHEAVLAADALPVVQSMLQAHPDLNVIICIADDGSLGALQAFEQTNPSQQRRDEMCIVGFDGSPAALAKIQADTALRATGALDVYEIGKTAIEVTANAIEGKKPVRVKFPYKLVTHETQDLIKQILEEYK